MSFARTAATTPALAASPKYPNVKLVPRLSQDRGHADHDWLKTFHTFSFASYYHPLYNGFGPLRVINEDRVAPSKGFGQHRHSEMEIFSYIVSGELEHKDSMGNVEIMKRGDVQMTSAGTGIAHSEYNAHPSLPVHFLQIWLLPSTPRLSPRYYTRHFTDASKTDRLVQVVGPLDGEGEVEDVREGTGPTPVHAPVSVYASILSPSRSVSHTFSGERKGYLHVIQTSGYNTGPSESEGARIRVNGPGGLELGEGDGVFVIGDNIEVENVGMGNAEFVLFDME